MDRMLTSLIIIIIFFSSCATPEDILYQVNDDIALNRLSYQPLSIQKGDILDIQISTVDPTAAAIFSKNQNNLNNNQADVLKIHGYLVNESGKILLPLLGEIDVLNRTTSQLADQLNYSLTEFLISPTVSVRILNYKVTVLGEVKNPGTFDFFEERITLPQILGTAGDLTIYGDRRKVQLYRFSNDQCQTFELDLTSNDLLNPLYFYLNPNDVIYVPPNTAKIKSSGLIGNAGTVVSIISLITSLTLIFTR